MRYIGARYVTKVYENSLDPSSAEWEAGVTYEPLTMVTYNNSSYMSKKDVPGSVGDPAANPSYWVVTGAYNGQILNLQNQITANADAINGILKDIVSDRKFESLREGSYHHPTFFADGQGTTVYNGELWSFGDAGGNVFNLTRLNKTFYTITATKQFNYDCHPNAAFVFNNYVYVVDSRNHKIFIIDSNADIIDVIDPGFSVTTGFCDENGNAYIGEGDNVYKLNADNTTELICTLANIDNNPGFVKQGWFIYGNLVYAFQNRPNMIVVYDLDGNAVGCIDVGVGNDFYPYGEIEAFYIDGDDVYMASSLWDNDGVIDIMEIFKTNIASDVANDSMYGQPAIQAGTLKVDNTASVKNGNGSTTAPFTSVYEACCVLQYLYTQYGYAFLIDVVAGTDYTNDKAILSGLSAAITFPSTSTKIRQIKAMGCSIDISTVTILNLIGQYSKIRVSNSTIVNQAVTHSDVNYATCVIGTSDSTSLSLTASSFYGDFDWNGTGISTITPTAPLYFKDIDVDILSNSISFDAMIDAIMKTGYYSAITIDLSVIYGGKNLKAALELDFALNDKSRYSNGQNTTVYAIATFSDGSGNPCFATFSVVLNGSTKKLDFTLLKAMDYSGTTITLNNVYADGLTIRNSNMSYSGEG